MCIAFSLTSARSTENYGGPEVEPKYFMCMARPTKKTNLAPLARHRHTQKKVHRVEASVENCATPSDPDPNRADQKGNRYPTVSDLLHGI